MDAASQHHPTPTPKIQARNKRWLWLSLLLVTVVAAGVWLFFMNNDRSKVQSVNDITAGTVAITPSGFNPLTITVKKGQAVSWSNQNGKPHHIKSDAFTALDTTEPIKAGGSYVYMFEQSGTYNYYDPADPIKHKGTVIVE